MRVALVHDYLTQYGGAERVLEELGTMFPDAPIFTLLWNPKELRGSFLDRDIRTSFLQNIPFAKTHHRFLPPLMPVAVEELDLSGFDLVISDSAGFAKGVIVDPGAVHIAFCHTPLRYAWDDSRHFIHEYRAFPRVLKVLAPLILAPLRVWDRAAAQRPDFFVANSAHVARRIKKYYARDATVVYPPVRTDFFSQYARAPGDAFLMVGRMLAYKRFDIGIEATKKLGVPLRIVGDGPEYKNLRAIAGPHVSFLGELDDKSLAKEYASARALLFPQEEDFGIVAVEAISAGTPVIARNAGGAVETVIPNHSGILVQGDSAEAFGEALASFRDDAFESASIRSYAKKFDVTNFRKTFADVVERALAQAS